MSCLTPIPLANLRELWSWMREGLAEVARKSKSDWIPDDVYAELRAGRCFAFAIGQDDGFLICRVDQRLTGPVLFIWAIWGPGGLAAFGKPVRDGLWQLAQEAGCKAVVHEGRKGWERVPGWKLTSCVYEMDVHG